MPLSDLIDPLSQDMPKIRDALNTRCSIVHSQYRRCQKIMAWPHPYQNALQFFHVPDSKGTAGMSRPADGLLDSQK